MRGCIGCGGEIPPTRRAGSLYCGVRCRNTQNQKRFRWKRNAKPCAACGAITHRPKYCSEGCFQQKRKARQRKRPDPAKRREQYQLRVYGRVLPIAQQYKSRHRAARALGFRSGLEVAVAKQLTDAGVGFEYEPFRIPFIQPSKPRYYCPDLVLPNGIVIELKGHFETADRQKHIILKDQYPSLDLRFVFSNPNTRISKQSKTSYGAWAAHKGFLYAAKTIPQAWIDEPPNEESLRCIAQLRGK